MLSGGRADDTVADMITKTLHGDLEPDLIVEGAASPPAAALYLSCMDVERDLPALRRHGITHVLQVEHATWQALRQSRGP